MTTEAPETAAIIYHPFQEGGVGSHDLLERAALQWSGGQSWPVTAGRWGKPEFIGVDAPYFSITHSGAWWMCAFACQPVGLDLQLHRLGAEPEKLSHRFFHPREDRWLSEAGYAPFFDLWAAKESYVKLLGQGFRKDPACFSVVGPEGEFPCLDGTAFRQIPFRSGYSLCLCARRPCAVALCPLTDETPPAL